MSETINGYAPPETTGETLQTEEGLKFARNVRDAATLEELVANEGFPGITNDALTIFDEKYSKDTEDAIKGSLEISEDAEIPQEALDSARLTAAKVLTLASWDRYRKKNGFTHAPLERSARLAAGDEFHSTSEEKLDQEKAWMDKIALTVTNAATSAAMLSQDPLEERGARRAMLDMHMRNANGGPFEAAEDPWGESEPENTKTLLHDPATVQEARNGDTKILPYHPESEQETKVEVKSQKKPGRILKIAIGATAAIAALGLFGADRMGSEETAPTTPTTVELDEAEEIGEGTLNTLLDAGMDDSEPATERQRPAPSRAEQEPEDTIATTEADPTTTEAETTTSTAPESSNEDVLAVVDKPESTQSTEAEPAPDTAVEETKPPAPEQVPIEPEQNPAPEPEKEVIIDSNGNAVEVVTQG